ncbi:hypothetical protein J2Z40_001026 [Cytobacillus eiseniae]|uniref:Spore coat protein n=1 Tax=Cytobacillus eiseniae TaxID=762947 RepID=A0ABS4RC40_9BACI|nr:hypothetical protein [Cytobacillus eiseniae]MBP2240471.1 hypothetical protein [Cytobacillus eiseniae]
MYNMRRSPYPGDSRFFFAGPLVGGLFGGLIGGFAGAAIARPRPFYGPPRPFYGPGPFYGPFPPYGYGFGYPVF